MAGAQNSKKVFFGTITTSEEFENFESLVVIDAASDMTFTDKDGGTCTWPSGRPFSIGGPSTKSSEYVKVTATAGNYALYK